MTKLGLLRPIQDDEVELIRSWRNEPTVRANMYTRHEISSEEHLAWWIRTCQRVDQQYFMYEFAGKPDGVVGLTGIDKINQCCSWAFYASPDAAKGTGSRMEYLTLNHVFDDLGLHKLCCEVLSFNHPVIKLHQKFGFQVEGILREQHKFENKYVDIYQLGMISHEWRVLREVMSFRLLQIIEAKNG